MDDQNCLRLIREGGKSTEQGIAGLFKRYAKPFKYYFMKHGMTQSDADDLVQEAFVSILRSYAGFRNECDIKIWLWKIARNTMLGKVRKKSPIHEDIDEMADYLAGEGAPECPSLSLDECVKQALKCFREMHVEKAETLTLAAVEGWSTKELADFLGRTFGATREYVSQCRKHFKPYLEQCREFL